MSFSKCQVIWQDATVPNQTWRSSAQWAHTIYGFVVTTCGLCLCLCNESVMWVTGVLQGELSLSCVIQLEFCATRHKNDTVSPAFYALIQALYHACVWQRWISFHQISRFTFILKFLHVHCARSTLIRRTFCTYVTLLCVSSWDMNVVACATLLTISTNAGCNLSSILVVLKVCVCTVWGSEYTPASSDTLWRLRVCGNKVIAACFYISGLMFTLGSITKLFASFTILVRSYIWGLMFIVVSWWNYLRLS